MTRVRTPGAFEVSAADAGSDAPLLILNRQEKQTVGRELRISGTVNLFNYDELVKEFSLGPRSDYREFAGRRVVVADFVDPVS